MKHLGEDLQKVVQPQSTTQSTQKQERSQNVSEPPSKHKQCSCKTVGRNGIHNPCDQVKYETRLPELKAKLIRDGICSCEGLGYIGFHFPTTHEDFGRVVPCICSGSGDEKNRKDMFVRASNLTSFEEKDFDTYKLSWNKGCKYGYDQSIAWSQGENEQFLTLYGATGVGKTHLALAAAWNLLARNEAVLFYQSSDLIRGLQSGIKTGNLEKLIEQCKGTPNLVIDDLGREYTTDWTTSIFHEIIDHRYRNYQLRTLVTTNHSLEQLNDIVGVPVVSRLTDSAKGNLVIMDGEDVRSRITELKNAK